MLNLHKHKNVTAFELLERRELFSAAISAVSEIALPQRLPVAVVGVSASAVRAVQTAGTGLTGEYFLDTGFQQGYLVRPDATVDLAGRKSDAAIQQSKAVRWTGSISPAYSEAYSFSVVSNGGVRLWVNGQLLINQAQSRGGNVRATSKITLVAGQTYTIKLEYTRQTTSAMKVKLLWASLHQKLGLIGQKSLFPDPTVSLPATTSGLIGSYYLGKNFEKLVMQRIDPAIDFNFGKTSPSPLIPAGASFSVRWTGQIVPAYSETYTFTTTSDDGVRLYIDDQLIIDNFTIHSATNNSAQITLVAGQKYDIRMDYFENTGVATAQLRWSSPSQPMEIVPASALSSTPAASAGTLTVVASTTDADAVDLSWTGSPTATGYIIQQSSDGGLTFTDIAATPADELSYVVDGLDQNKNYSFRVLPLGSSDTSVPSNWTPITTATTSPTGTAVAPLSDTSVSVSWNDVAGENGFIVYQAPGGSNAFVPIGRVAKGVTSFVVTGLTPGADYQYEVRALNSAAVLSDPGTITETFTPAAAPGSVSQPNATTNSVILNWADSAGETGFSIERSLDDSTWTPIGTTGQGVTTYTDSTVLPGTEYFYRIRSLDSAGASDPSSEINTVTATLAPGSVSSTATTTAGTLLNWPDVNGESGFVVLESTDGGNSFSELGVTPVGVTNFSVSGLQSGANYQFAVEALNQAGTPSAPSGVVAVVTLPAAPASLVTSAISANSTVITWTPVTGATGFILQRSTTGTGNWNTIATLPASTLTYTDSALAAGTNYYYQIISSNSGGMSDPSTAASVLTIPAVPTATIAGLSAAQSQVSWNPVNGATQYIVQRSTDGSTNWTTVATANGSAVSAVINNLANSTMYYYRVQASNATGSSGQSPVVSQITAPLSQYAVHNVVYGTTNTGAIYAVDLTSGSSNWIGKLPVIPAGAVRDPVSGVMYFYEKGTSNIYVWDPTTGNTTLVDTSFIPSPTATGAYLPDGTAYIVGTNGVLYKGASETLSVSTVGSLTIGGMPFTGEPTSMTFSPNGTLYMTVGPNIYTVNTSTAAVTPIASTVIGNILAVFGPKGVLYTTAPNGSLYSFNLTTLVSTLLDNGNLPSFTSLAADVVFTHLGITATASPSTFTKGGTGSYAINVSNSTGDGSTQPISVTTTLQAGVTFESVTGTGWTASVSGQTVTLTYTGGVAANGQLPVCTMNIALASSVSSTVTTTFNVVGSDFDNSVAPGSTTVVTLAN